MSLPYDRNLEPLARSLRTSMTDAERRLWSAIRRKQVQGCLFTRQKTIGRFIVDFYCASASLVVEVDGGQHCADGGRASDLRRDEALNALGLRVLRFSDRDVLTKRQEVLEVIWRACAQESNPLAPPFPKGEAGAGPAIGSSPVAKGEAETGAASGSHLLPKGEAGTGPSIGSSPVAKREAETGAASGSHLLPKGEAGTGPAIGFPPLGKGGRGV